MGSSKLNKAQVAEILRNFINGEGEEWDWDDFISVSIDDDYLDSIRIRCAGLREEFPPENNEGYCSQEGVDVIKKYIDELSK